MKAHRVINYYICQITGNVSVHMFFAIDKDAYEVISFESKAFADLYIEKEQRHWLLICLEKWIAHKRNVYAGDPYKTTQVQKIDAVYDELSTKRLETIVKRLITGEEFLKSILPNENNPSYQSSLDNLNEIISFCKTYKP